MKAYVVANFVSGKGRCVSIAPVVQRILDETGAEHTLFQTVDKETNLRVIANNAGKYDIIICMGGDGTVNEVLNALASVDSHTPVGYIPCGSTNDFAANYNLSSDPKTAMERILRAEPLHIDVGCLNGNYFCYVAAAGAFSEVSYATKRSEKQILGKAAYIIEGAKSLPNIKPIQLSAELADETVEGNFLISTFSNSSRVGGVFKFPNGMVDYTDGLMELTLVQEPANPVKFVELFGDLLGGNCKNEHIRIFHTDKVRICSSQPIPWSLDGEYGGSFTETEIHTVKNGLTII